MIQIDLLRNDPVTRQARMVIEKRWAGRRAILRRYRQSDKNKKNQQRYQTSERGMATQRAYAATAPRKQYPMTEAQRARKNQKELARYREKSRTDPEYREQRRIAARARHEKLRLVPRSEEQKQQRRDYMRDYMRVWGPARSEEQKTARRAYMRAWSSARTPEQKNTERSYRARWLAAHPTYERDRGRAVYATEAGKRRKLDASKKYWGTERGRKKRQEFTRSPLGRKISAAAAARRRALVRSVAVELQDGDWEKLKTAYGDSCAYCSKLGKMTQDHVQPLSRRGPHALTNLVPACRSCNSKKRALLPGDAFLLLGVDPDKFWMRHEHIVSEIRGNQ